MGNDSFLELFVETSILITSAGPTQHSLNFHEKVLPLLKCQAPLPLILLFGVRFSYETGPFDNVLDGSVGKSYFNTRFPNLIWATKLFYRGVI